MAVNHYQNLVDNINYEDINEWQIPDIYHFSDKKVLFPYQVEALKNTAKLLKTFYSSPNGKKNFTSFAFPTVWRVIFVYKNILNRLMNVRE